ncbi:MAG: FAD-linked oxidase C-terminal domain-containing protein, partial [Solirubrobacteraceae bacterium]
LTPAFDQSEGLERYEAFLEELVELIVGKYDGSLKAEHGTGVNMAPYVEREWGAKATEMMWRVKALADPRGVLNPDSVLNRDPGVHLRNLKSQPEIEESAAHCVECGFCEPVCPSRNTTTTPRQRIAIRREMARQVEGSPVYESLMADFEHEAIETCAADGTCQQACPVAIDTGALMKEFRRRERSEREEAAAASLARRYAAAEAAARAGLRGARAASSLLGRERVEAIPLAIRRRVSAELIPTLPASLPAPAAAGMPQTARAGAAAVYMPACINRVFGNPDGLGGAGGPSLPEALVAVSARAGQPVWIPGDVAGHCCGTPWSSKGYRRGHELMAVKTARSMWRWSEGGSLPVVIDASSCALGLIEELAPHLPEAERERFLQIEVLDSITWVHDRLLEHLRVGRRAPSAAIHPTCSVTRMGTTEKLQAIARALAEEVSIPAGTTCCGMAGDRGLLHPELPASALADAAADLAKHPAVEHLCSNRTCELALQGVTGAPYESFVLLLERLTRGSA